MPAVDADRRTRAATAVGPARLPHLPAVVGRRRARVPVTTVPAAGRTNRRDAEHVTAGLLVVTAVAAEAEAVRAGLTGDTVTVAPVGVGPAAAGRRHRPAARAGRGGRTPVPGGDQRRASAAASRTGPASAPPCSATRSIAADLGAEIAGRLPPARRAGLRRRRARQRRPGAARTGCAPRCRGATVGDVLTVSTVTGTAATRRARSPPATRTRWPRRWRGTASPSPPPRPACPFAELRTISNPIGPRDRARAGGITEAFDGARRAAAAGAGDMIARAGYAWYVGRGTLAGVLALPERHVRLPRAGARAGAGRAAGRGDLRRRRRDQHRGRAGRVRPGQGELRGAAVAARRLRAAALRRRARAAAAVRWC